MNKELTDRIAELQGADHEVQLVLSKMFGDDVPEDAWVHPSSLSGEWTQTSWENGSNWGTCPEYTGTYNLTEPMKLLPEGWIDLGYGKDRRGYSHKLFHEEHGGLIGSFARTPQNALLLAVLKARGLGDE